MEKRLNRDKREEWITAYAFVLPVVVMWTIWFFVPLVQSVVMSFYNYSMIKMSDNHFVGLANYARLFQDNYFWISVQHTLTFVSITVPATLVVTLPIACLLNAKIRARTFFRAAYYVPNVVSSIAVTTVFMYFFVKNAALARFFSLFGIDNVSWFTDVTLALPFIMMIFVWQSAGFYIIIYLSGLQTIPEEIYESAKIDGASEVQTFFRVTIPMLRPTLTFGLTYSIIASFQVFDQIAAISQTRPLGTPAGATSTMVTYFYTHAFKYFDMGYGCAGAIMLFLLIVLVSVVQRKMLGRDEVA